MSSFAQVVDNPETPVIKKDLSEVTRSKILLELKSLSSVPFDQVEKKLQEFNGKVLYYVQRRNSECKGEFSSIEINENGESELVKRKLSQSERSLCLLELVHFRKNYLNEIFKIRKRLLILTQNQQLKDLENIHKESIRKMDELTTKLSK